MIAMDEPPDPLFSVLSTRCCRIVWLRTWRTTPDSLERRPDMEDMAVNSRRATTPPFNSRRKTEVTVSADGATG